MIPIHFYQQFADIIMEKNLACVRILGSAIPSREDYAKNVVNVLMIRGTPIEGIKTLISEEIKSTDEANVIFRGNSLATKTLDIYMKIIGSDYLFNTLSGVIRDVFKSKESCEIDPLKVEKGQLELKKNRRRLLIHLKAFWEAIHQSVDKCPT